MSRAMGQNSLTPWGNNNLNFRLTRDQVVHLEAAVNFGASPRQENNFFDTRIQFVLFLSWEV